jgi:regulator of protease activity HflC (stomatin/prohibitin superfamily)
MNEWVVRDGYCGLLYEDGVLVDVLPPGKHKRGGGWGDRTRRELTFVDLRERSVTIKNQEILTADKVAVRLSLLVYLRVVDAKAAHQNVVDFQDHVYEDVQLAARRFLATRTLDQILRDRNEISDAIREDVRASAQSYGVEILRADVKDLVFPGNLREIMNRVIETERESEAAVIAASKTAQVARIKAEAETMAAKERLEADRAAAQLLAENPQLVRLRELEVLREIGLSGGNQFYIGLDNLITGGTGPAGMRSTNDAT